MARRQTVPVDLRTSPCRTLCDWSAPRDRDGLFSCAGCGSQWEPGQRWTPRQADGTVPPAVRAAREAAFRVSAASAGGAGSGDS